MGTLKYLGHSAFELVMGDTVMFIDPWLGGTSAKRSVPSALANAHSIKKCDIIFLTHEHFDHCDPEVVKEIAERTYASVVAPRETLAMLDIPQKLKVDVKEGDDFDLKGVHVRVVKAVHPQSRHPVGYIISDGNTSIYHAGDTYEYSEMMDIKCDYALLPIGGTYTMDDIAAEKAAKNIQCKAVIPMHFDTFDQIKSDPMTFAKGLEGRKKVILMRYGAELKF